MKVIIIVLCLINFAAILGLRYYVSDQVEDIKIKFDSRFNEAQFTCNPS